MSDFESDFDEEKFNAEMEEINIQFPNASFSIGIALKEIDSVVINTDQVAIKCDFNCYCYDAVPRISEYFICKKEKNITNRDLINCLIENNFDTNCNHHFLELFEIKSSGQVEPFFGS